MTANYGETPKSPVICVALTFVTVDPARTAKFAEVPGMESARTLLADQGVAKRRTSSRRYVGSASPYFS